MNLHEFYIGKAFDAYEYFGAHLTKNGVLFRVYAPRKYLPEDHNSYFSSSSTLHLKNDSLPNLR